MGRLIRYILLVVLFCAQPPAWAAQAQDEEPLAHESLLEALTVVDLKGRQWDRQALAGQVVLVDFWATWCAPCLAQLPKLRTVYERYRDAGFEVVAVSLDQSSRSHLLSWLRRHDMPWVVVHEERGFEGPVARRFQVEAVPRSFLFDRAGRLIAVDLDSDALLAVLGSLLPLASGEAQPPATAIRGDGALTAGAARGK